VLSDNEPERKIAHPPADQRRADETDFILAALDHIRGVQEASLLKSESRLLMTLIINKEERKTGKNHVAKIPAFQPSS
jgi:hypothetical protein